MTVDVKVPMLPESVADATVAIWHKKPGETVTCDENLLDLETDKVVLEVPAPASGVLGEILKAEGTTVVSDELLTRINSIEAGAKVQEVKPADVKPVSTAQPSQKTGDVPSPSTPEAGNKNEVILSPSVRRLVMEHDIDPGQLVGTGKGGRITKEDVVTFIQSTEKTSEQEPEQLSVVTGERYEKRVPMSRLRARIAERLLQSQQTTAMLTTFNEIDMQAIFDLRKQYKDEFEKTHGVRLGFMSFFTKAVIEALKRSPVVNASIDDDDIVYHDYYDIGIAVSSPRGLVVPILRDADQMTLSNMEKNIAGMAERANSGKLTVEEMTGGTFTISNGGVFGSLLSTPILNPPQSGILGMHKIEQRPVAVNGEVVIRPMMYVALSYDHRIIDGKESVTFLKTVKNLLEDPSRLLLGL